MTDTNNAAQPVLTDDEILAATLYGQSEARMIRNGRAIESTVLSKLRAPVADERVSLRGAANLAFNALHECKPAKGAEKQYSDAIQALQSALHDIAYTVNRTATPQQFADHLQREARAALARTAVASAEVMDALNWVDDFIARCNRDDRGSCESVNVLRRALASAPVAGEAVTIVENRPWPVGWSPLTGHGRWYQIKPLGTDLLPDGTTLYAAPQASEAAAPKEGKTYAEGYYKGTRDALATESAKRNAGYAGYAGVTVWVGDKQVTQVVTKQILESSNADELLRSFEAARFTLSAQPDAEPLSNPKQFVLTAADERTAFEATYQADYDDPGAACEREHFGKGYRAGMVAQSAKEQGESDA